MSFFDDAVFSATFGIFGADATLTVGGTPYALTVIDKTAGVEMTDLNTGILTVRPVAEVRASELATLGLTRADLRTASLSVNGQSYRIEATLPKPTPFGEDDGRYWLVLMGV